MEVGNKINNFCLKNEISENISIDKYFGKWIILYFYPKDNTSGCTKEAIGFTERIAEFEKRNAVVIGISPDKPQSHVSFIKKYDLKIVLLSDENKEILKKFGAWGKKMNYGKEYEGVIRSTFIINPQQEIVYKWTNVKVEQKTKNGDVNHADAVLKKLDEIQQ